MANDSEQIEKNDNFSIYIMTHDSTTEDIDIIKNTLEIFPIHVFNGQGYPSFSKVVNDIIIESENDTIILINRKARPKKTDIFKMLQLLKKGFGFVGLYRWGFFGFNKNLIKKIGFYDERFINGGYEDSDYYLRLVKNNIASYIAEEIDYIQRPSSWNYELSKIFYDKKWKHDSTTNIYYQNISDEKYDYELKIKENNDLYMDVSHSYNSVYPDDRSLFVAKFIDTFKYQT